MNNFDSNYNDELALAAADGDEIAPIEGWTLDDFADLTPAREADTAH